MGRTSDAKQRLMRAVLDLMWGGSYGSVTIDDICTRAEVKKGSFYHFFESKAELAVAALDWLWTEQWKPTLDRHFSPSVDPLQRITSYLSLAYERQCTMQVETGKVRGCPLCTLGSEVTDQEPKVGAKVRELIGLKQRYWESAIRDAIAAGVIEPCEPAQKAACLSALIDGVTAQARITNNPELIRPLPQIALEYLRVKSPATA